MNGSTLRMATERRAQRPGQRGKQFFAIPDAGLATLIELDDMPADFPASLHPHYIQGPPSFMAGLANQSGQVAEQCLHL